jgi:2-keto-3-deoxy-L-rhamnonate aldolase RhmA
MGIDINTPLTEHPQLRRAMERTAEAALAAGKFCGTVTIGPAAARMAVDMGYRLLAGGGDSLFIRTCSAQRLAELRGETT